MSSDSPIDEVVNGRSRLAVFRPRSGWSWDPPNDALMLSGSFRPLHRGHRALLNAGWEISGARLTRCFEISIENVEKPDIAAEDLESRLDQFRRDDDIVVITRAATFVEKARLMPGTTFAIGHDTAVRLFEDRFYDVTDQGSPTAAALGELRELGASFVVGGRHDADGEFKTVQDISILEGFEDLLVEIPESLFADPISSTQLRRSERTV